VSAEPTQIARHFLEKEEDGNASDFVSIGDLKKLARAHLTAASEKDAAYLERNRMVALLAGIYPSGIARTNIPGWLPEWHGCVYIDLPTGQASWHYHDSHAHLFAHLPAYTKAWDGHTTDLKYMRVAALASSTAEDRRLARRGQMY